MFLIWRIIIVILIIIVISFVIRFCKKTFPLEFLEKLIKKELKGKDYVLLLVRPVLQKIL